MRASPSRFSTSPLGRRYKGWQLKERITLLWETARPRETNALSWLALILGVALIVRVAWVLVSQPESTEQGGGGGGTGDKGHGGAIVR